MKKKHRTQEQKDRIAKRKANAKYRMGNFYEEKLTTVNNKVYSQYIPVKPKPEAEGMNIIQMIKTQLYTNAMKVLGMFRG